MKNDLKNEDTYKVKHRFACFILFYCVIYLYI